MVGCRFGTEDAVAHFNHVQIDFHDTVFSPEKLDQYGEICFYRLSEVGARVEGEDVLRRLLGDGASSTCDATVALVLFVGMAYGVEVESAVFVEFGVLVIDDRVDEFGRDVFERYPVVAQVELAPLLSCLNLAHEHERSKRDRDKLEEQDNAYRAHQEDEHEASEEISESVCHGRR